MLYQDPKTFPLTLAQQDVFFDQLKYSDSPLYNIGGYIALGGVDLPRLRIAHQQLIMNHDAYGLRMLVENNQVRQFVANTPRTTELPLVDFSAESNPAKAADDWLKSLFETPLEIENSELFKACILRLSESEHRYVGLAHHLMMDGWGFANWSEQLLQHYSAQIPSEQPLAWQDIAHKDQEYLSKKQYKRDSEFWAEQLKTLPPPFLPTLHTKQVASTGVVGDRCTLVIPTDLHTGVQRQATKYGVSVAQLYLACVALYFSKTYRQETISIGLPAHNRSGPAQKQTLGVFTSVSPLSLSVDLQATLKELCAKLAQQQRRLYRHQRLPIGHMLRDGASLSEHRNRLYDVSFNYLVMNANLTVGDEQASLQYVSHNHEQTPITVTVWEKETEEPVSLLLDYNANFFNSDQVNSIGERLLHLFAQLPSYEAGPLHEFSLLPEAEARLLQRFSTDQTCVQSRSVLLQQGLEQSAATRANQRAIVCEDQSLTFEQLNVRANQLARLIQQLPLTSGNIGVCLPRASWLFVSMLAVLKAGRTFVPLDPAYPQSRLIQIAEDADLDGVLCQQDAEERFPSFSTICLDDPRLLDTLSSQSTVTPTVDGELPSRPAYIVYTSGSTGRPKGVVVSHQAIANHIDDMAQRLGVTDSDKVLQIATYGFDTFLEQVFAAFLRGATLHVNGDALLDTPDFFKALKSNEITLTDISPAYLSQLLEVGTDEDWAGLLLSRLVVGGESLPASTISKWLASPISRTCKLYNAYGPTECVITTSVHCIEDHTDAYQNSIGKVIGNRTLEVLDELGEPCLLGVPGELCIRGGALADGYWGNSEATERAFFKSSNGTRTYRTGDQVYQTHEGDLVYLGRTDSQIKIRGFRVEPGEIERQLCELHGVKSAHVQLTGLATENPLLVAYLIAEPAESSADYQTMVRQSLSTALPSYMVPDRVICLSAFPLTANGKIDVQALPEPTFTQAKAIHRPTTAEEMAVVTLCEKLLGLDPGTVGLNDNFFDLGGHSLLAMTLVSELRKELGVDCSIKWVFDATNLATLASSLKNSNPTTHSSFQLDSGELPKETVLSFAQQRLWLIDQIQRSSSEYNMCCAYNIRGDFDPKFAAKALQMLVQKHPSLRTTYRKGTHYPLQRIQSADEVHFEQHDLSLVADEQKHLEWERIQQRFSQSAFDLTSDLLIRGCVVRMDLEAGQVSGRLLLCLHHIAADGASVEVLEQDFAAFYDQLHKHGSAVCKASEVTYRHFAVAEQNAAQKSDYQSELDYWQAQLAELPELHGLPLQGKRKTERTASQAGYFVGEIGSQISKQLENFAQKHSLTPFMVLHGALSHLIARHSNATDIAVGTAVSNRPCSELHDTVGLFVNSLVLRTDHKNRDLDTFWRHVKDVNTQAQQHAQLPFEVLCKTLNKSANTPYSPLFQILLVLNAKPVAELSLGNCSLTPIQGSPGYAKFDLEVHVSRHPQGLSVEWVYDKHLFSLSAVKQWHTHFVGLLDKLFNEQVDQLSDLTLLSKREEDELLHQLNPSPLPYPKDLLIHQLFEKQVAQHPERLAIQCAREQITYAELNKRANALASTLLNATKDRVRVGVCLSRNCNLAVALMGIFKAGHSYVALDPNYPQERLRYIAKDADLALVISDDSNHKLAKCLVETTINVDALLQDFDTQQGVDGHNLDKPLSINQPAYVIYTSGSTGTPKGVAINHSSACAMLHWADDYFSPNELHRVLASTSLNFDLSVFEIFAPLCFGHQCVMVENALDLIDGDWDVSLINTVPSAAKVLLDKGAIPASAVTVNLAGEPLPTRLLNDLLALPNIKRVVNLYGPSEDTTYSTVASFDSPIAGTPVIGSVIANSFALVLNEDLQLVPKGTPGELFLGGDGLATGYLNRPELTEQKFIDNPFGPGRLYRTGDRVRYTSGVDFEFLGRLDEQIKLNGFRIELGEINHHLSLTPSVREATVIVREDRPGIRQLVAYIQLRHEAQRDGAEEAIKAQLRASLPHFMVPSQFVFLDALPQTANGKIDKKALPEPQQDTRTNSHSWSLTECEQQVLNCIAHTLQVPADKIDPTANFFDLGGHSLLAVKLSSEIQNALARDVTINEIFEAATVLDLVTLSAEKSPMSHKPNITKQGTDEHSPFPLSSAQQRLWFLNSLEQDKQSQFNMVKAFQVTGSFDLGYAEAAINRVFERHPTLRTRFYEDESGPVQQIQASASFALQVNNLTSLSATAKAAYLEAGIREQSAAPFDLNRDPMLRAHYYIQNDSEGQESGVLLICLHHIAADGWSLDILVNEFIHHYHSMSGHSLAALPEPEIHYRDYAIWQQNQLHQPWLQEQLDYWQVFLANAPSSHQLPLDNPRQINNRQSGTFHHAITPGLTRSIKTFAAEHQASLFMVLQAAFALHIARLSNQNDVVMGGPVAGRTRPEVKHLIGLFLNTQLYRTQLEDNPTFVALIKQTREQHLMANRFNDVPFEAIVDRLNPPRDRLMSPVFQVMINLDNNQQRALELEGAHIQSLDVHALENKYDITLYVRETSDSEAPTVSFEWAYDAGIFNPETIALFAQEFEYLLGQLIALPQLPVLNHTWQQAAKPLGAIEETPELPSIAAMFESQVRKHPHKTALRFEHQQLSFGELDDAVNRLAHLLSSRYDVRGNKAVAVATSRGVNRVVTILALLKLGACYVPLSEELPSERATYILSVSNIHLVIADESYQASQSLVTQYCDEQDFKVLNLDCPSTVKQLTEQSTAPLTGISIAPQECAHLIFTSGSTGHPKGVAGTYQATINRISWMLNDMPFEETDITAHLTSMAFIRSVWELLVPLCAGTQLTLLPRATVKDVRLLWQYLHQQPVTRIVTAPSTLKALSRLSESTDSLSLRYWFVSGEPLLMSLAQALLKWAPQIKLYNLYGSTEVMSDISFCRIDPGWTQTLAPIGRPITNTQLQIMGPNLQPVPRGVVGEILVQGPALSSGYINAPEKQAKQFVTVEGVRGFLTGDVGRVNRAGLLECHGRVDDQVKIRGYRVEPSEIASCLESLPSVQTAVVVLSDDSTPRLIAYCVLNDETPNSDSISSLKTALRSKLPEYMIPSAFVPVDHIPLRPNGKVNRQALPAPAAMDDELIQSPTTSLQRELRVIWANVLGIEEQKIGVQCNFFDLGGHSLLVAQLLQRLESQFHIKMSFGDFFEHTCIQSVAEWIEHQQPNHKVITSSQTRKKRLVI